MSIQEDRQKVIRQEMDLSDFVEDHFNELFDHYTSNGEMPYGVAKARTGDPDQWIFEKLQQEFRTLL